MALASRFIALGMNQRAVVAAYYCGQIRDGIL